MIIRSLAALAALAALALPSSAAQAATVQPFHVLNCAPQGTAAGARFCQPPDTRPSTRVGSFDLTQLDANVALPPASAGDGPFPLIVISHGWGGKKNAFEDTGSEADYVGTLKALANKGYAVLSFTARGFNGSCGTPQEKNDHPIYCPSGYIRLDDYRFEAMDIEYLAGKLVDQGIAKPDIGVSGESYGGGVSLELAVLKNRMCADLYGPTHTCEKLAPWKTEKGTAMSIAASAPIIPWSDLVYSLLPNGRTLDYTITNPYVDTDHRGDDATEIGIEKASYVSGLFAVGNTTGYIQPPMIEQSNTKADLTTWFARINAGEPYDDPVALEAVDLIARFRSPYNMPLPEGGPSPLFIANGWTDDLFPPDEALRFANKVKSGNPDAPLSLLFGDFGHARGGNSPGDQTTVRTRVQALMDHYLLGTGSAPANGVEAYLQVCPNPKPKASPGPAFAASWPGLHTGEVRFLAKDNATVPPAGDPREDQVSDPIAGGDACATASAGTDQSGTSTYRLPAVKDKPYTLLGSPTVIGNFAVMSGTSSQIAARLWDVAPDGSETLVAKGLYRPFGTGTEVLQLHANGWTFAVGHTPRLQLLGSDKPYARPSNSPASVTVSNLQLRLPVVEAADCKQVLSPAAPVLPDASTGLSRTLAPGVSPTAAPAATCASPTQGTTGATPGTSGGRPVDSTGATVTSSGTGSTGTPSTKPSAGGSKKAKGRIVFGRYRVRTLSWLRHKGLTPSIRCTVKCRVTTVMRFRTHRIGGVKRSHGANTARVKTVASAAGARRIARSRGVRRVTITVTVQTTAGKRLTRRTGVFVVRR